MLFSEALETVILKFNPYHDAKGRFTSGKGAHSVSTKAGEKFATALGMKVHGHDIAREDIKSQVAHMGQHKGSLAGWESPTKGTKKTEATKSPDKKTESSKDNSAKELPQQVKDVIAAHPANLATKLHLEVPGKTAEQLQADVTEHLKSHKWTTKEIDELHPDALAVVAATHGISLAGKKKSDLPAVQAELKEKLGLVQVTKTPKAALKETVEATGQDPKSKAAAKTAASVVVASKTPEGKPRPVVDTIPKANELTLKGSGSGMGGTGSKQIYTDKDGNEYLFKPAVTKSGGQVEPFRADVQEGASKLSRMIKENPLDTVEVKAITLDGKVGTIQKVLPVKGDASKLTPENMTAAQHKQLLEEHTVDWLLGNFDSHAGNFVEMRNGRLLGVDKEQSFRYIDDAKSGKMSTTYAPNKSYGTADPIYNGLFQAHANGKVKLDLQEVEKTVKRVEAIPDTKYREMFRPYAESLKGQGQEAEALLDKIVTRKNSLRSDYEEFFGKLEGQAFKFGETSQTKTVSPDHVHSETTPEPFKGKTVKDIAGKGPAYWETVLTHANSTEIKSLASELGIQHKGDLGDTQAAISAHYKTVAGPGAIKTNFPNKADLQGLSKESLKNLAFKEGLVETNSNRHKAEYVDMLNNHFQAKRGELKPPAVITPTSSLGSKKVTDLKSMAKEAGIKGYSSMTKEQLVQALQGATGADSMGTFKGASLKGQNGEYLGSVTTGEHLSSVINGNHSKMWGGHGVKTGLDTCASELIGYAKNIGVGLTHDEAKAAVNGAREFTGGSSGSIRLAQFQHAQGQTVSYPKALELGQNADKMIELAPKWDSKGTLYRKIQVPEDKTEFWDKIKPGEIISQVHGTSSWSSKDIWSGNVQFIMNQGTMMGASVKNLSYYSGENEVMVHSGARQMIDKVEKEGYLTKIYVTEIPPVTPSTLGSLQKRSEGVEYINQIEGGEIMKEDKEEIRDKLPDDDFAVYDRDSGEWITAKGESIGGEEPKQAE